MLTFWNKGLIDIAAVTTMGVSVKKPGSFGYFGTGLKMSLASILRWGGAIEISRGLEVYRFGVTEKLIAGQAFQIVTMTGPDGATRELGFTTELAKTWEPWMVLRELACNARDEGGSYEAHLVAGDPEGAVDQEGETIVRVWSDKLDDAHRNSGALFLDRSVPPIWADRNVEVRQGPSKFLYYQGIRVHTLDAPSAHCYNLISTHTLTEDRTLANIYLAQIHVRDAILAVDSEQVAREALEGQVWERVLTWDSDYTLPGRHWLNAAIAVKEAHKSSDTGGLTDSARKAMAREMRAQEPEEAIQYSAGQRHDGLTLAIERLREVGIEFSEDQAFVTVDELPGSALSIIERRRVYLHRRLLGRSGHDIAMELVKRWTDLTSDGFSVDSAVSLLAPIIVGHCMGLKPPEVLIVENQEAEDIPAPETPPTRDEMVPDDGPLF